jgi:hypothetical protein
MFLYFSGAFRDIYVPHKEKGMADKVGRVVLTLGARVPLKKPWDEQYVFDRLLSEVKGLQERVKHQFGVEVVFDLIQLWPGGNVRRREKFPLADDQDDAPEVL